MRQTGASPGARPKSEGTDAPAKDLAFIRSESRFYAANFRRPLAQQPGNSISRFLDDRDDRWPASQFQVLTDLAPIEPHRAPDLAVWHQPLRHPRINGPRRYIHPYRHFHFRDMLIICTKFILHRSSGAARHDDLGRHREEQQNSYCRRRRAERQLIDAKKGCPIGTALTSLRLCKRNLRLPALRVRLPPRQPAARESHLSVGRG